mgnify:CR=1 FL=1
MESDPDTDVDVDVDADADVVPDAATDADVSLSLPKDVFDHLENTTRSERRVKHGQTMNAIDADIDLQSELPSAEYSRDEKLRDKSPEMSGPTMEPPAHHELDSCDYCGRTHKATIGQGVAERGTSVLTNESDEEYLCEFCFAQVVSQRVGYGLLESYILVDSTENCGNAPWRVTQHLGRDDVDIIYPIAKELLVQWQTKTAHDKKGNTSLLDDSDKALVELISSVNHINAVLTAA